MQDEFKNILDDDEYIVKLFKPNKFKFVFDRLITFSIVWLVIFLMLTIMYFTADEETGDMPYSVFIIAAGIMLVSLLILILTIGISYKKRFYAYSNKRILIQSGFIGIDFKGLDHKMIGATEVRVDFIDKLLKRNTGTLKFGSQASPMGGNIPSMFIFTSVHHPYEVYKEIKKYIDSVKEGKEESD